MEIPPWNFQICLSKDVQCVNHSMKSVQIQSYFRSVFSCIPTEYGDLLVFGHFSRSESY